MRDGKIRAEGGDSGPSEIGAPVADLSAYRAARNASRAPQAAVERRILCLEGHWHPISESRVLDAICRAPWVPQCEVSAMLVDYLNSADLDAGTVVIEPLAAEDIAELGGDPEGAA